MGAPWEEHDGHGVVSDWTTRDKAPEERVLAIDRNHRRYYDVKATIAKARKEGWGCSHPAGHHKTRKEAIACAVDQDFEYCRAWCNDGWEWTAVIVTLEDKDSDYNGETASVSGIDGDHDGGHYLTAGLQRVICSCAIRAEACTGGSGRHLLEG